MAETDDVMGFVLVGSWTLLPRFFHKNISISSSNLLPIRRGHNDDEQGTYNNISIYLELYFCTQVNVNPLCWKQSEQFSNC